MAVKVKLYLTSGERRTVDADGAHLDDTFFIVTLSGYTVLTLWAQQVERADIEKDGVVTESVPGAGPQTH